MYAILTNPFRDIDGIHNFDIVIHKDGYTTKNKVKTTLQNDACTYSMLRSSHNIKVPPGTTAFINTIASQRGKGRTHPNANIIVDPCTAAGLKRPIAIYTGLYTLDE